MSSDTASNRTFIALLTIAVSIYLLEKLGSVAAALGNVILLLALSWFLAFTLRPAVEWARRRRGERAANALARLHLPYGLAVTVVYLLLLAALVYGVLALVPVVIEQVGQLASTINRLATDLPGTYQRLVEWMSNLRQTLIRDFNIDPAAIPLPQDLIGQAGSLLGGIATGLGQFVLGVVTFLSQLLLVLLISAYVMVDGRTLMAQLIHVMPDRFTRGSRLWLSTLDRTFGGFIRGTLLQAFVYGVVVTLLMLTFGLDFAVVVGVATGILMLIPYVGGIIGLALPLLAGLLQSSENTLLLVVLLFVFQIVLFNLIMPRILSQSLRMPTLLVFVALIVGGQLLGVWGLLFAVPAAGALYSIGLALLHQAKYNTEMEAPHDASHEAPGGEETNARG